MPVVKASASILGRVPDALWSFVTQTEEPGNEEPPTKRRKLLKQVQRANEALESGKKFIPLFQSTLDITFEQPAEARKEPTSNGVVDEFVSLPVTFQFARTGFYASNDILVTSLDGRVILRQTVYDLIDLPGMMDLRHVIEIINDTQRQGPGCLLQTHLKAASLDGRSFQLESKFLMESSAEFFNGARRTGWTNLLRKWFFDEKSEEEPVKIGPSLNIRNRYLLTGGKWSPRDFYDSVHIPEKTEESVLGVDSSLVHCELYPFQKRAVRWLLENEGVEVLATGELRQETRSTVTDLPESFSQHTDIDGNPFFVSSLLGIVTSDISSWDQGYMGLRGGILAEEMGLGKTVEMIALICLHRRRFSQNGIGAGLNGQSELTQSGATLIISPPSILEQWKQEINNHAPSLRVMHYEGIQRHQHEYDNEELIKKLSDCDVVITTYNVLSKEIHYAEVAPERSLRNKKRFEPRKTPLVQISWWRVCLDEAQMIESGVGNAARVARLIPRHNAWAVSGTPIRKDAKDLFGLLLFLDYEPFCFSQELWASLLESYKPVLRSIVGKIALRHTKEFIRDELSLPPQKRIVITIPFTAIEEQHYDNLFGQMCEECGLDSSGGPLTLDWDPNSQTTIEKMRSWLMRLRQTCLHPEISGANRRALGPSTNALHSVEEVLEVMVEQNIAAIRTEERAYLLSQIRRGQMHENAHNRHEALAIWKKALEASEVIIQECRKQLAEKLSDIEDGGYLSSIAASTVEDEGAEKNRTLGNYRRALRSALEVQHVCIFFTANAYYQIKSDADLIKSDSEQFKEMEKLEEAAYEAAKQVRKELLSDAIRKVSRFTDTIQLKSKNNEFVKLPRMRPETYDGGLESQDVVDRLEGICEALNDHAKQYDEWRDKMVKLLLQSLIDQEEGTKLEGDEYETSTKHQDEMYVYMEALRAMFADRHGAITGQTNELIAHETKRGIYMAKKGEGPSPELFLSIVATREELKPVPELGSLRGIVSELRSMVTSLEWQESGGSRRARAELEIVKAAFNSASKMSSEQSKVLLNLEKEVEFFRDTMNNRLEFYRQLQHISDMVAPYEEENQGKPLDEAAFARMVENEHALDTKISGLKSKLRYLFHLRDESGEDDASRICVICQSSFEIGVLTVCGHKYCKDCLRMWWSQHRSCPTCKKRLKSNDFHQISYKPKELVVQEERSTARIVANRTESKKMSIYSDISSGVLRAIRNIDLDSSFGTKVDTLCRHLIWLRANDPGAKSIVFSQYKNFLGVLATAFKRFDIGFSSVESKDGIEKFKSDPSTECFLLHARAHSSGLNLVNATHVFLCEPLINTAIELQAIARVHRIGQHSPTTVWMYLVSNTVEESVYDISVSRRLTHILEKENKEKEISDINDVGQLAIGNVTETAIDAANTNEVQDAPVAKLMAGGAASGEMVGKDDLWQCLFGKASMNGLSKSESTDERQREIGRFLRGEAAEERRDGGAVNGAASANGSA
ncbi:hypothetical protein FQN54_000697 [Arachnomyces sp. PD_36]|nr:hypothetical protein FQN54_000697 [Arachnomyces sp. PD_36]